MDTDDIDVTGNLDDQLHQDEQEDEPTSSFDITDIASKVLLSQQELIQAITLNNEFLNNSSPKKEKEKPPQTCSQCGTNKTSFWRRNKDGQFECNACNLYFRKNQRYRPACLLRRGIMKRNRKNRMNNKRSNNNNSQETSEDDPSASKMVLVRANLENGQSSNENNPMTMLMNSSNQRDTSQMEVDNNNAKNGHSSVATATITATFPITSFPIKLETPETVSEFTTPHSTSSNFLNANPSSEQPRPVSQQSANNKSNRSTPFSDSSPSSSVANDTFNHHYARKWTMDMKDKIVKGLESGMFSRMPYSIGVDFESFSKLFNVTTGEAVAIQCNICGLIFSPNAMGQLGAHKTVCSRPNGHSTSTGLSKPESTLIPPINVAIQPYPVNPQAKSTALQSVARLCVTDFMPFFAMDSPGFKRYTDDVLQFGYLAGLNAAKNKSNYSAPTSNDFLPNGQTVSRYIGDCVSERLPVFVEFMKTNVRKHGAAIAIDVPSNGVNLIGFSISFIDDNWRYHTYLLDIQEIDLADEKTGAIQECLQRLLLKYGLFTENKNIVVITKNTKMGLKDFSTVGCVGEFLGDLLDFIFGDQKEAHQEIQILPEIKEELVRINSLISSLMEIVGVIKRRPELKNNLSTRFLQASDCRHLIWRSCLDLFLGLSETDYQSIRDLFATHPTLISKLGTLLGSRQILTLLQTSVDHIQNLLKKYEKSSKPTLNTLIMDLNGLKKHYTTISRSELNTLKAIGVAVAKFLEVKFEGFVEREHTNAMILDPMYKNHLRFLVDEKRFQKAKDHFKSSVYSFIVKSSNPFVPEDLDSFDGLPHPDDDPIDYETKTYLRLKKDASDGFPTVLDFWKVNERTYPMISKLARKTLCIPASSTCSEEIYKVFSKSTSKGKNSFDCDTVSKIVSTIFLQKFAQSMS